MWRFFFEKNSPQTLNVLIPYFLQPGVQEFFPINVSVRLSIGNIFTFFRKISKIAIFEGIQNWRELLIKIADKML